MFFLHILIIGDGIVINSISINEFIKIANTVNVIDLRRIESFNNGHIDGARNAPFNQLIISPDKYLKKEQNYYLYCSHGSKSLKACQILSRQGYHVFNILGGYEAWILAK